MYDADETEEVCDDEAKGASDIMEKIEFNLIGLEDALKSDLFIYILIYTRIFPFSYIKFTILKKTKITLQ